MILYEVHQIVFKVKFNSSIGTHRNQRAVKFKRLKNNNR